MTCEFANDFHTLDDFFNNEFDSLKETETGRNKILEIYGYFFALILYLYISVGIIHDDLHTSNIMIHNDIVNNIVKNNIYIIDYGLVNEDNKNKGLIERYLEFYESIESKDILIYETIDFFDSFGNLN